MGFLSGILPKDKLSFSASKRFIAIMAIALLVILQLGRMTTIAVADPPTLKGGTPVTDREYIAFRDASDSLFKDTLWIQDVTECKSDQGECNANTGAGLNSKSYQVAYCLNKASAMPYDMEEHKDSMKYDKNTGLWTGAQKYWRYEPSDTLIKNYVKDNSGKDANLRAIKKVLYYGYHDADDSQWQKDNKIQDIEFREGTQYALWHYTDNLDPYNTAGWGWQNGNVKKVYDYLVERETALSDAPVDFKVNFFHTDEKSNSHDGKYQNLVSVRTIATPEEPKPNKPEPKRTKIQFKKVDEETNTPLGGVTIKVKAYSKLEGDSSILFEKTLQLTNDDKAVLDNLETDVHYVIEETVVPAGWAKRSYTMSVDKNGKVTFEGDTPHAVVKDGSTDEHGFISSSEVTLQNHKEPSPDKAELKTTVKAGESVGSIDKEASVDPGEVQVIDTVAYKGLEDGKPYVLKAELMKEGTELVKTEYKEFLPKSPVGTIQVDFGKVNLELGKKYVVFESVIKAEDATKMETEGGKATYTAKDGKKWLEHKDPNDKAQTVVVGKPSVPEPKGSLKTTVSVDGKKASVDAPVEVDPAVKATVVDTIDYKGLVKDKEYTFAGRLMEIPATGEPKEVAKAESKQVVKAADGSVEVTFKDVKLEAGRTYVVFETATSTENLSEGGKKPHVVKHEDPKDKSQTVKVKETPVPEPKGSLKTTVSVDGKKATVEAPVEVDPAVKATVVDTIDYKGLVKDKEYTFSGRLMEVPSDGSAPKEIAKAETKQVVKAADGSVEVTFENVKLEAGRTYVVFETATSTENLSEGGKRPHVVKHEDPSDKSQTVKVKQTPPPSPEELKGSLRTTVSVNGMAASEKAPVEVDPADKATVKDKIDYKGLVANKEYTFSGRLMEIPSDGSALKEVASASVKKMVDAADGSVEVTFENVKLEAGKTYVVFETATSTENLSEGGKKPHVVKHEDPKDKSQTVKVKELPEPTPEEPKGSLKTTVSVDGKKATVEAPVEVDPAVKATVVDTIDYKGLVANKEYTFAGRLMEIPATGEPKEVAKAESKQVVKAADGSVEVTFENVKLEAGKTYVVFETATSTENLSEGGKKPHVVKHEDPKDKSQTVKVKELPEPTPEEPKGELRTTVSVNGMAASEKAPVEVDPADKATVKDKIDYAGLVAGKEYTFNGRLMEIPATGEPKEVASASVKKMVDAADGSVEVTFENVKLEAGKTYVVFETATSTENLSEGGKKPHVVKHEDPKDKSQTVKVKETPVPEPKGEMKTTVKAGDSTAAVDKEASAQAGEVEVADTVAYKGLEAGKEYVLKAELMEDGTKAIKTVYHSFTPAKADGEEAVPFGKVTLKAGKKYVVFESAIKTEDATKAEDGSYTAKDGKKWIEHKDANDKAQTVVVEKPTEPEPPAPTPEPKGSLRTTVSVDGKKATVEAPVEVDPAVKATVVDKIDYTGLVANKEYTFAGRLMEIPATGEPKEVASASVKKMVDAADGSVEVTFKDVKLEAGRTYVVFETATSTENLSEGGKKPHVVKHEDPSDKSQTVKVKQTPPAPPTPPVPNIPGKPGEPGPKPPAPHVPGKPALTDTGVSSTGSLVGALGCLVSGALVLLYRRRRFK